MPEEILKRNLDVIQKANPRLFGQVTGWLGRLDTLDGRCMEKTSTSGQPRLVWVDGSHEPALTAEDPLSEASEAFNTVNIRQTKILVVLGIGGGHLLDVIRGRMGTALKHVLVIEQSPAIFIHALNNMDLTPFFNDSRFHFMADLKSVNAQSNLYTYLCNCTLACLQDVQFIIPPSSARLFLPSYLEIIDALVKAREVVLINLGDSIDDQYLALINIFQNFDTMSKVPPITKLTNRFQSIPAIIVSAGPSLNKNIAELKRVQEKALIVCVDSVLRPLLAAGIRPHFTAALERGDAVAELLTGLGDTPDIYLVAMNVVTPEAFRQYHGPAFLTARPYDFCRPLPFPMGYLATGGSAGNMAYAIAATLGCDPIIICGQDFAYDPHSLQSHVNGTGDPRRELRFTVDELRAYAKNRWGYDIHQIEGYYGGHVWTNPFWERFLRQLEAQIDTRTMLNLTTINSTEGGALIRGARMMPLKDALGQFLLPEPTALRKRIAEVYHETPDNERLEKLSGLSASLVESLDFLQSAQEKCASLTTRIVEFIGRIEDAEKCGRSLKISVLNQCIDDILLLKNRLVSQEAADHLDSTKANITAIRESELSAYHYLRGVAAPYLIHFDMELIHTRGTFSNDYDLKKFYITKHRKYFDTLSTCLRKIIPAIKRAKSDCDKLIGALQSGSVSEQRRSSAEC